MEQNELTETRRFLLASIMKAQLFSRRLGYINLSKDAKPADLLAQFDDVQADLDEAKALLDAARAEITSSARKGLVVVASNLEAS